MRAVLSLCFLVATTIACPTCETKTKITVEKSWPVVCPQTWSVRKFDSQCVSNNITVCHITHNTIGTRVNEVMDFI